jgi:hypothetical protein
MRIRSSSYLNPKPPFNLNLKILDLNHPHFISKQKTMHILDKMNKVIIYFLLYNQSLIQDIR